MENGFIKVKGRNNVIADISNRIKKMSDVCASIRTLSGVFVGYDKGVVIDASKLIASWDADHRPKLRGQIIRFINFKGMELITVTNAEQISLGEVVKNPTHIKIKDLTDNELQSIYFYMEQMIPKL
jgi:hypothetical protein